ncbi:hypothetical protein F511_27252 [Dorcoceras hygrometricum]|uniref:Dystroglycan-like n=1 Tax=Dorcoceras hygrometricum TaxID=472368 RepID=A0A2Z7ARV1_9LAMI|nr:hypothetical protein F511_27252 [Dorcoceras hygrometricum]
MESPRRGGRNKSNHDGNGRRRAAADGRRHKQQSLRVKLVSLGVHTSAACAGHFAAECNRHKRDNRHRQDDKRADDRYKKEERYKRDEEDDERAVDKSKDKFKERSKDRRMRTSSNKKPSQRNDRKVLMAEESTKSWADSDSESSSSSPSSSDTEQEEAHCLMADHASDDEVFDFANTEYTREDLVQALNDMVHEYKTLSHTFEEIKAENASLKNSSAESGSDELEDTDSLKTELSRLKIENDLLRNEASQLKAEVDKLTKEMSSWNQSTRSLFKLYESQKPVNDKTGVGFNYDSSYGETSTQSQPVYDKFNERSFVKGGVIYDCLELIRYDDHDTSQLDRKGKGKIESYCISQLQVTCSGGIVDNQSKEATYVGDTSREVPVARYQSRGTSHKMPVVGTLALYRLPEMASSLIINSHHIDFESVFRLDDAGMVKMFETLIATGLKEFLGCPAVFYEDALTEFFANSSVREDGMVVSTIGGTAIEISQEMFAEAFELPTEGLIDLTDVPKNFVFDARSLFSDSKEQVSMSCLKKALKFHYRLLHDILERTIYVKAGSFDSVTRDRFLLMTTITFDVKINWSSLLFGVFKEMVTPGSRQAKGYAIQICVLLRNVPGLELGESKSFPVPRILNEKTVHRFVSVNENVGIKEVADAPRARRTRVKKTVSKKRPATGDDEVAPVIKKKRTTKGKPVAVKRLMVEEPDTAISTSGKPVAEDAIGEREPVAEVAPGDADVAIEQVLAQLESVFKHQDADRSEKVDTWFDEAFDEEFEIANKERQVLEEVIDVTIEEGTGERSMSRKSVAEELMTIDDLLLQISNDMFLPSITAAEVTMIRLGEFSSIGDKGKAILVEDEQITENPASEIVALICRDVEVLVRVRDSVMKAVVDFFASFSLNSMPDMESLKDLKEKEKLMMEWAETNTLATAVRRQMYVLTKYREMLLHTFLESCRRYLALDQPWTDMAVQVISLLSAAHSQSLEDFKPQQQEHKIEMVQPKSSLPAIDSIDRRCSSCSFLLHRKIYLLGATNGVDR